MRALPGTRKVWQGNSMNTEKRRAIMFGSALAGTVLAIAVAMSLDIQLGKDRQSAKYAALEADHQATAAAMKKLGAQAEANDRFRGSKASRPLTADELAERTWAAAEAKWMDTDGNPATEPKHPTIASTLAPAPCVNYIEKQNGERHCFGTISATRTP